MFLSKIKNKRMMLFKNKKKLFILYWAITNEQYCDSFRWTARDSAVLI